jgi:hypothetical protein
MALRNLFIDFGGIPRKQFHFVPRWRARLAAARVSEAKEYILQTDGAGLPGG